MNSYSAKIASILVRARNLLGVGTAVIGISLGAPSAYATVTVPAYTNYYSLAQTTPGQFPTSKSGMLGAYIWKGWLELGNQQNFSASTAFLDTVGFKTIRVVISPKYKTDYGLPVPDPGPSSLSDVLDLPDIKAGLMNSTASLVTLTTYDYTTYDAGWDGFMSHIATYVDNHEQAIFAEYFRYYEKLFTQYNGRGKTFVVTNWEGDNTLYNCTTDYSGYHQGALADMAHACKSARQTNFAIDQNQAETAQTLAKWLLLRKAALIAARELVGGTSDVKIYSGVEFNWLHAMQDQAAYPSFLPHVVPVVKPDVVLYSAYESLKNSFADKEENKKANTITKDLAYIRKFLDDNGMKNTRIGIGEVAYFDTPTEMRKQLREAYAAIFSGTNDVAFAYVWRAFNSTHCAGDKSVEDSNADCLGLYQPDGTPYGADKGIVPNKVELFPRIDTSGALPTAHIAFPTDPTEGGTLKITGYFPKGPYPFPDFFVNCAGNMDHEYASLSIRSNSDSEIVAELPRYFEGKACSLRVFSSTGYPSPWTLPVFLDP